MVIAMGVGLWPAGAQESADDPLAAAWGQATESGSYRFRGDVEQVTSPTATALNAGRTIRTENMRLEGDVDLAAASTEFRVWAGSGNVLDEAASLAMRVVDGVTERQLPSGAWQSADGPASTMAPSGDMMAYLGAATDVTDLGQEARGGVVVQRYGFQIDGPAYATSMAEQLQDAMRRAGTLPAGDTVVVSAYYRDMTGVGELWVDETGQPLRQVLSLAFPERDGELVRANMRIDFLDHGYAGVVSMGLFARASDALGAMMVLDRQAVAVLAVISVTLLGLVMIRRRWYLSPSFSLGLVGALLLSGPLSGSASNVNDAPLAATAPAAAPTPTPTPEDLAGAQLARDVAAAGPITVDPHQDPLARAAGVDATDGTLRAAAVGGAGGVVAVAAPAPTNNGDDTDGDGLPDFTEERIGTDPAFADSDGDGIEDGVEVAGFTLGSSTLRWYSDPLAIDSNGDGISDTVEYDVTGDDAPDDTDGDGIPDVYDHDNDGDGVPDGIDLSPFTVGDRTFDADNPLALTIDGLTAKPTNGDPHLPAFVDFQLRPVDEEQLRFGYSPMDWPSDSRGQLRDINGSTDDLELIPMLEIVVPDPDHVLPSDEDLGTYSATAGPVAEDSDDRIAYLPLSLVTDQKTGARVAFSGRMPYLAQASWGAAHEVSMVWAVKLRNDIPCDPTDTTSTTAIAGCAADGFARDQTQIVHRYDAAWELTGLQVTEEHGAKIAVAYEDPTVDLDVADNAPTWALSSVLDQRFLMPIDNGGTPSYELTTGNFKAGYDRYANGGATPYGLPDIFRVQDASYDTFGEGVITTAETESTRILSSAFSSRWTGADSLRPMLLMAWSTSSRTLTLDRDLRYDVDGYVGGAGRLISLDLAPGAGPTPITTIAGMKLSQYCGGTSTDTPVWSACETGAILDKIADDSLGISVDPQDPWSVKTDLDADSAKGQEIVTQLYAVTLLQGVTTVQSMQVPGQSPQVVAPDTSAATTLAVTSEVAGGIKSGKRIVKAIANQMVLGQFGDEASDLIQELGKRQLGARLTKFLSTESRLATGAVAIGLFVALVAFQTVAILALTGNAEAAIAVKVVLVALTGLMSVILPIRNLVALARAPVIAVVAGSPAAVSLASQRAASISSARTAAAIGAVIAIGVTWGFFIAGIVSNGLTAFSPAFNQALSATIAATIYILLSTALSLTGVGLIIVGIIAFIDVLLTLICELGVDDLKSEYTDGGCFTLGGAAVKTLSIAFYAYELMVDAEAADLVEAGEVTIELQSPDEGYVVGNRLDVTLPITNNVRHVAPKPSSWQVWLYPWFYSEDNVLSTAFDYSLTSPDPVTLSAERDTMSASWDTPVLVGEDGDIDLYGTSRAEVLEIADGIPFDTAGIDREIDVHFNTAYALPAFECWSAPLPVPPFATPVCYERSLEDAATSSFDPMYYDILPATVDGFIELADRPGGRHALAWDSRFEPLLDADGDGAVASGAGGLDPDDTNPDTDGDGLTDQFEIGQREQGLAMSPGLFDTDLDGLTDLQELRLGTDPGVADTDNDGLTDGEEVHHLVYAINDEGNVEWTGTLAGGWDVTVPAALETAITVTVSSDPLHADADNDGISDDAEKQLAESDDSADWVDDDSRPYHPNVTNTRPVEVVVTTTDVDMFVAPGQTVDVVTEVTAKLPLAPGVLDLRTSLTVGVVAPTLLPFDASGTEVITTTTPVTVPADAGSELTILADARTRLQGDAPQPPTFA
ncbi:MAG: hypothetical protein ACI9OB_000234, partial [Nonlabens sp.]